MLTVHEVSKISGVSIRTLQYYDNIGLLKPRDYTEAGYRLYDNDSLERLQQILLFKELEFPLSEIKSIIDAPNFDKKKALDQQIELLTLQKEHLEKILDFARNIKKSGGKKMDFSAFDTTKIEEYSKKAKEQWGQTSQYKEYEKKTKGQSKEKMQETADEFMLIFKQFGQIKTSDPCSDEAKKLVEELKSFISDNYYTCTNDILKSLGQMYTSREFADNIDKAGGEGTAEFAARAIESYCLDKK